VHEDQAQQAEPEGAEVASGETHASEASAAALKEGVRFRTLKADVGVVVRRALETAFVCRQRTPASRGTPPPPCRDPPTAFHLCGHGARRTGALTGRRASAPRGDRRPQGGRYRSGFDL